MAIADVYVPSYATTSIGSASRATGLPYALVAAYVHDVSGFDSRLVSPDGRQGPYQFDVSEFYRVWHGSPFSWHDSTQAFIRATVQAIRQAGGDIRQALAVVRYGPAGAEAGLAWAERLMEDAGYTGLASRGTPLPVLASAELTDPDVTGDDWSWYVGQAGVWLKQIGDTATYWADYIGRL